MPTKKKLTNFLQTKIEDCDEDDTIEFNQWICRTQMIDLINSAKIDDFIDDLDVYKRQAFKWTTKAGKNILFNFICNFRLPTLKSTIFQHLLSSLPL